MTTTTRISIFVRLVALTAAFTVGPAAFSSTARAGTEPLPPPPGEIVLIDYTGEAASLNGDPLIPGVPTTVAAGDHTLNIGEATQGVTIGSGCYVTVIAYLHEGPTEEPQIAQSTECPLQRAPENQATVRWIVATPEESTPNGLQVQIGEQTLHARTGEASLRQAVAAGTEIPIVISIDGQVLRSETIDLQPHTAHTIAFGGGGEAPPFLSVVIDGNQPREDPPPAGPDLGHSRTDQSSGPGAAALLVVLACSALAWLLIRRHPRRAAVCGIVAVLAISSCATAETEVSTDPPTLVNTDPSTIVGSQPNPNDGRQATTDGPHEDEAAPPTQVTLPGGEPASIRTVRTSTDLLSGLPDPFVGWYGGSGPTGGGNLILGGHITWGGEPGVFEPITRLQIGDAVTVTSETETITYLVDGAVTRPKHDPWTAAWAPTANPGLILVTCTGDTDTNTGLHLDNLWVHASRSEESP